ncbi:DNA cytosine methyltransferase [Domibacillus indicus]|uniref:DNA cytosine methyltransferase n=1 Tax=Domibacillus indicus TaxID=1437523 RepID=UPI000617E240|nr:DNA cytosine methyltransferase [Domibacillus indicus]
MNYNAISLFSGAMGLDLGIEKAGIEIKVCVEKDKWAKSTIERNTNIPVIHKDITAVTSEEILEKANLKKGEVFLIAGGPPCQSFSSAGKQRGLADFRGNTIIRYLNIVEEIEPQYFIMENVRGLISAKLNEVPVEFKEYEDIKDVKGSVMYFLQNEFKKYGYTISFTLFNAANYGVPQKRERMIIFGYKGKERIPLPRPTHSENGTIRDTLPWVSIDKVIGDLEPATEKDYIPLGEKAKKYLSMLKQGQYWKDLPEGVAKEAMGNSYELGGGKTGFFRRLNMSEPSPTLVTSPSMPATMLCHPTDLRPLSIKEYARIQQFPDHWIFEGGIREVYKQIGNAVPVGLGYIAAKNILNFHEERNLLVPYSRYKNTTDFEFNNFFLTQLGKSSIVKKQQKKEEVINFESKDFEEQVILDLEI